MSLPLIAVVMAGGRGTRFWPRSRALRPKQFLPMAGDQPLLVQTVERLRPDVEPRHVYVVTTEDLAEATRALLPELPPENVIVEPEGRNTAPCLALALAVIARRVPEGVMAVLSADHWIGDRDLFIGDLRVAAGHAEREGALVTFGIRPAFPETGYGYIEAEGEGPVCAVRAFREKPDRATAMDYVASGRHFWNAGIFVWTLKDMRAELQRHAPELLQPLEAWAAAGADASTLAATYGKLPKISIDYALMEKSDRVAVVPARFRWSDVGSWPAAAAFVDPDARGNATQGDVVLVDADNCAVFGGRRLVACAGVQDLIVVDEPDALLVCRRDRAQEVKTIVERLQAAGRTDLL
jgi:mannose-1-phosphate guanylyltransferase